MGVVTTLFIPMTVGAGETTLQPFVLRLALASRVKPVKSVAHDSTTWVLPTGAILRSGGGVARNTFRTGSWMLWEPFP